MFYKIYNKVTLSTTVKVTVLKAYFRYSEVRLHVKFIYFCLLTLEQPQFGEKDFKSDRTDCGSLFETIKTFMVVHVNVVKTFTPQLCPQFSDI